MAGNVVRYTLAVKDQVSTRLAKINDNFDRLGKSKGFKSLAQGVGIGAGIGAFNLLSSAVGGVTDALAGAVRGAIEDQRSQALLEQSIRANAGNWEDYEGTITAVIKANQKLGFSDDDTRDSLRGLVAATHDVNTALSVQRTAMDLARFKGISLADASEALTKVEAGSYRILKSLGIVLKEGATQQDALNAVQKIATGQADAYASTVEGKMVIAQDRINESMEDLGRKILPLVSGGLEVLNGVLDTMGPSIDLVGYKLEHQGNRIVKVLDASAQSSFAASRHMADFGGSIGKAADSAVTGTPKFAKLDDKVSDVAGDAGDAKWALAGLADILDTRYGAEIKAGRLAELRDRLKELKTKQKEFTKGSSDWIILQGEIAQTNEDITLLQGDMAKAADDDTFLAWLRKQSKATGLNADEMAYWRNQINLTIARIRALNITIAHQSLSGITGTTYARQHGGPVSPFGTYTVGERGPETLVMGKQGGFVIPHGGTAGSSGMTPAVIALNLDGREVARIVDKNLYYSLGISPGTTTRT
jgi:hypothetical protein